MPPKKEHTLIIKFSPNLTKHMLVRKKVGEMKRRVAPNLPRGPGGKFMKSGSTPPAVVKRKRGRPKGSKNKPKSIIVAS